MVVVAVSGTMINRTHGDADSGVTSIAPIANTIAKTKCAIPRIRQRHIAGPREGLY